MLNRSLELFLMAIVLNGLQFQMVWNKGGGVLSPTLFGIYVDGLLDKLKENGIGCHVGDVFCEGIGYADDIILLVPTYKGLKNMVLTCEKYASDFNIIFNGKKSQLMVIGKRKSDCDIFVSGEKVIKVPRMNIWSILVIL